MTKFTFLLVNLFLLQIAFSAQLLGEEKVLETKVIFRKRVDGYNNIRIPAICYTKDGTLLAFAEGREAGDKGDIDLIMRRSKDRGKTWGEIHVIWDHKINTCGNPCPVVPIYGGALPPNGGMRSGCIFIDGLHYAHCTCL